MQLSMIINLAFTYLFLGGLFIVLETYREGRGKGHFWHDDAGCCLGMVLGWPLYYTWWGIYWCLNKLYWRAYQKRNDR